MWFYLGVDLGSEAIVTWVYGTSKEGIILDFYRQMVRNYAMWGLPLPAEIECESNLNADYRDGFLERRQHVPNRSDRVQQCPKQALRSLLETDTLPVGKTAYRLDRASVCPFGSQPGRSG